MSEHYTGTGRVRSVESSALSALRALEMEEQYVNGLPSILGSVPVVEDIYRA
jgi:Ribonuclease G/E